MSYKPRTLFRLLEDIERRELLLPHIQRPFVWDEDQMVRLFDSLMRNFPIQTLLFWRTKDYIKARRFMTPIDWDANLSDLYDEEKSRANVEKVFVLDGQQRLQTLLALFQGGIREDKETKLFAYVDLANPLETPYSIQFLELAPALPLYRLADLMVKDQQKNAEELSDDINEQLDELLTESLEEKKVRTKQVRRNLSQLVSLLREEKHFWVQELDGVANEFSYSKILDIFVRVNSGGTKLDASDLMFAVMKEGWDEFEEAIEETTELLNGTNLSFDKTFALKCLLVAHGRGAETGAEKFSGDAGRALLKTINENWELAEAAFQQLRDFIVHDLRLFSSKVIRTYSSFIPLFDYLYHNPKPDEKSRIAMKSYHYKSQLFGWYSRSTDGLINTLHGIVGKPLPDGFPLAELVAYFRNRNYDTELTVKQLQTTSLRTLFLNLIYVESNGVSPFDVRFKGNDPHADHIYPKHMLSTKLGLLRAEVDHIGNFRLIGATDNVRKKAELPDSYFARLKQAGVDIKRHLLIEGFSNDPRQLRFDVDTYRKFRDERYRVIEATLKRVIDGI